MNHVIAPIVIVLALRPAVVHAETWHVPAPGSAERAQVMSAVRNELSRFDPNAGDLRFVVHELCVSGKTGWIAAEPRSADGTNHYEPVSASLRKRAGRWVVDSLACTEETCPEGETPEGVRRRVRPACG